MSSKAARSLYRQGLNRDKYDRLARSAVLCGQVRKDVWQRCRRASAAPPTPYDIRDAWMAEDYDCHGLPARLGKSVMTDAPGDIDAAREAAAPVKKAIWNRTRGDGEGGRLLYFLLKQNRWTEDPFLHWQMRQQWRRGRSHVTNQIVADAGSYTTKVWHGRAWIHLQSVECGQRCAILLKGTHLPSGTLRIILRANSQVAVHHVVDEEQVCSIKSCGQGTVGVDKGYTEAYTDSDGERRGESLGDLLSAESDQRKVKGQRRNQLREVEQGQRARGDHLCQAAHANVDKAGAIACEDVSVSMQSAKYRHQDTNRCLNGWVKGVMADTPISISRRRGLVRALVNPAYTSQIDSRTGLLQATRRWDRFYCTDGVGLDADANAACNIPARLYDEEITLYMSCRDVRALVAERTRQSAGTARPGLELRGLATMPPSTESKLPGTHKV